MKWLLSIIRHCNFIPGVRFSQKILIKESRSCMLCWWSKPNTCTNTCNRSFTELKQSLFIGRSWNFIHNYRVYRAPSTEIYFYIPTWCPLGLPGGWQWHPGSDDLTKVNMFAACRRDGDTFLFIRLDPENGFFNKKFYVYKFIIQATNLRWMSEFQYQHKQQKNSEKSSVGDSFNIDFRWW